MLEHAPQCVFARPEGKEIDPFRSWSKSENPDRAQVGGVLEYALQCVSNYPATITFAPSFEAFPGAASQTSPRPAR